MKLIRWVEERLSKRLKRTSLKSSSRLEESDPFVHSDSIQFSSFTTSSSDWTQPQSNDTNNSFCNQHSSTQDNNTRTHKPTPVRQRSLIKTNPWLPAPCSVRKDSYCSNSSTSTDSGCSVPNYSSIELLPSNDLKYFNHQSPVIVSSPTIIAKCESSDSGPATTDDEELYSHSSNLYSSCSTIGEATLINQLLPLNSCDQLKPKHYSNQNFELTNNYKWLSKKTAKKWPSLQSQVSKPAQLYSSKLNRYPCAFVYKKGYKMCSNEKWVYTVTDLIPSPSSEDESDQLLSYVEKNDQYVPSPAPEHPLSNLDINHYTRTLSRLGTMKETFSSHPLLPVNCQNDQSIEPCYDQLSQTSPLTADSGYGLSEASDKSSPCLEELSTMLFSEAYNIDWLKCQIQTLRKELNAIKVTSSDNEKLKQEQKQRDLLNQIMIYKQMIFIQTLEKLKYTPSN